MFESRAPWDEDGKYTLDRIGVSFSNHFFLPLVLANRSLDLL